MPSQLIKFTAHEPPTYREFMVPCRGKGQEGTFKFRVIGLESARDGVVVIAESLEPVPFWPDAPSPHEPGINYVSPGYV